MVWSSLLAGLVTNAVIVAAQGTTPAQTFVALNQQPAYSSLAPCERPCLAGDKESDNYSNEEDAKKNCPDLPNALSAVQTCYSNLCAASPNVTQLYDAESLLASFCTAVAANYTISVPNVLPALLTISGSVGAVLPTQAAASPSSTVAGAASATASSDTAEVATVTASSGTAGSTSTIASSSIAGPTTPITRTSDTGHDPVPTSSSSDSRADGSSATPSSNSTFNSTAKSTSNHGLTSSEKVGVGVGVGLGLPILLGIIAALFFFSKRRKSRSAGPYGPVMTSEKGISESGSYGGPHAEPHEMQHMSSAAPFLPAIVTHDMEPKGIQYEQTPQTGNSFEDQPHPYEQQAPLRQPEPYAGMGRPATSRDVSRASTPPLDTQHRPVTAPQQLEPVEDEPPSPVSPVSAMSAADSRPASLRHSTEHDLRR
ncbi:hypothetical protein LTR85_011929 [Meristemomyces frigidus]|nr:hypothetical protein LTR85_011929 [Meristemomyces frigidus]